jgi:hypothetical protein
MYNVARGVATSQEDNALSGLGGLGFVTLITKGFAASLGYFALSGLGGIVGFALLARGVATSLEDNALSGLVCGGLRGINKEGLRHFV